MRKGFQHFYLLLLLLCVLSACGSSESGATDTGAANNTGNTTAATVGVKDCPATVRAAAYWDPIVPTQADINRVEKVTCANLMGKASLQAVIQVRTVDNHTLDVYVYDNILNPGPNRIFELRNLYDGDVQISGYNSLLTAETNTGKGAPAADANTKVYREFQWSEQAGTLVQVAFPGIYPLTRYEAQQIQQQRKDAWQNAEAVARDFVTNQTLPLQWTGDVQTSIVSGGGAKDTQAVVNVRGPGTLKLTMQRLEGNTNGGIWVITKVESDGLEITAPQSQDHLVNPATVSVKGSGDIKVFDYKYTAISAPVPATGGATSVNYDSDFKSGKQEGLIVLSTTGDDGVISRLTIVKVLLG